MNGRQLADPDADGWEKTEFPVVCEDCLGPNPYVRMVKMDYGGECAISGRPFTVFRWRPGAEARYKKTVVCKEVALAKNVCQVCLMDLDYGVPVQVRDKILGQEAPEDAIHGSDVNREYVTAQIAQKIEESGHSAIAYPGAGGKAISAANHEMLLRMGKRGPYYRKNKPPICTFWLKGKCTRADCPYRPCNGDYEMPELKSSVELRTQNIKDRYYGTNDPVANQMMQRASSRGTEPPSDTSITTLFLAGVDQTIAEHNLNEELRKHGEIRGIRMVPAKRCAFVTFHERSGAEEAIKGCGGMMHINGSNIKVSWGRPAAPRGNMPPQAGVCPPARPSGSAPPGAPPPPPPMPPSGPGVAHPYPSMNPHAMGTINKD